MPIPASVIGTSTPTISVTVERGRLQLFAKAIGQSDPVYTDVEAAKAEGLPDLPVPPTFLFGLELEQPEPFRWIADLGVDMNTVLHGDQTFTYEQMAYAGETLHSTSTITDVYAKKGGALEFVRRLTEVVRDGAVIATMDQTIVVRNAA
jgi:acyl dehydratase